tara:strand:+ start:1048 stop:1395 length:348 start_codon:yes stop_codon:yes gene_type:complete
MKNRSKRLRKKLYRDEFAQVGFSFKGKCRSPLEFYEDSMDVIDDFVEYLESNGLGVCIIVGNARTRSINGIIMKASRYGMTNDDDTRFVKAWLCDNCEAYEISRHFDLNYEVSPL